MSSQNLHCPPGMVAYSIKQLQHAFRVRMDAELLALKLSTAQYSLLTAISQGAGSSSAELARRCFIKPPSVRELIVRLEQDGLISRSASESHGRIIEIRLTRAGQARLNSSRERVATIEAQMLQNLTEGQRSTLASMLQLCVRALETC